MGDAAVAASRLPADSVLAERGHLLWEAIAASAALEAAGELGVVDRLKAGPVAPGQLARDCGLGERGAQLLLAALAGLGVVAASGDGSYHGEAADLAALVAL